MKGLSPLFLKLEQVKQALPKLRSQALELGGVQGGALALLAAELGRTLGQEVLVVVEHFEEARALAEDLGFYLDPQEIRFFPHYDTIPYDRQSPDKEVVAQRLLSLLGLLQGRPGVTVTTPQALSQVLLPKAVLAGAAFVLKVTDLFEPAELARKLSQLGYVRVDQVEDKGEFSVRGEIFDLYPIQLENPVRVDFFDIEVESIKSFDPVSQLSLGALESILVLPAQEVIYSPERIEVGLSELKALREGTDPLEFGQIYEAISEGLSFSGIENFLPLFYPEPQRLLDYLPPSALVLVHEAESVFNRAKDAFAETKQEWDYSVNEGLPTLAPDRLFWPPERLSEELAPRKPLFSQSLESQKSGALSLSCLTNQGLSALSGDLESARQSPLRRTLGQLKNWYQQGAKVLLSTDSLAHAQQLKEILAEMELTVEIEREWTSADRWHFFSEPKRPSEPGFVLLPQPLNQGFRHVDLSGNLQLVVVNQEDLFGPKQKKRRVRGTKAKDLFTSLEDLKVGDYVVHMEYGIGQYHGLIGIDAGGHTEDFLLLTYSGGDKVYVPVDKLNLVQKFTGSEGGAMPRLNKLGDKAWAKTKAKVKAEVDDMAGELLVLYAKRKAQRGVAFSPEGSLAQEFALSFPYEETPDQLRAIEEVARDMESEVPMDRLVCGDVGFGKTEVAMRACLKAVADSYQVGLLVPTTILAQQHYETLVERFKPFPVKIGLVSRFQKPKQITETLKALESGQLDILVGTHRLLSKDVQFKKLGLLVIDEEQRFGVRHKEQLKAMRTQVDCLSLSATPIPRTLHMSLMGIRDISVINTPPMDRRAIRTRLLKFSDFVIQEAVERELRRGGQIFFIHNRVESIYEVATYLNALLPRIKLGIAHGQMGETELEEVMHGFIAKDFDLLLATAIVESGLDIPNANTILVNNADQFGLAQLYQLRGRVGRSRAQAYAYFLTPKDKLLSEIAKKRLSILQELNHLGAGFKIASYDLELRGAGNLLGASQSGQIQAVGFELYTQMIEEAIGQLTETGPPETAKSEVRLDLGLAANLPESYIPSMNLRLEAYKEVSLAKTEEELWELRAGLEDRFGPLPASGANLFLSMQIKLLAQSMAIERVGIKGKEMELSFGPAFRPDPNKLFALIQASKVPIRPAPGSRLILGLQGDVEAALVLLKTLKPRLLEINLEEVHPTL